MRTKYLLYYITVIFTFVKAFAQPVQVKEIPDGSHDHFEALGQLFFFHNDSLWKSDGTAGGTVFIKDLEVPVSYFRNNLRVYERSSDFFFGFFDGSKVRLFRSNGTAQGTSVVETYDRIVALGVMDNQFFYGAETNGTSSLYKVGNSAPVKLKNLDVIFNRSGPAILNGYLYFIAATGELSTGLYKTNGTSAGTIKVAETRDYDLDPYELIVSGGLVYYTQSLYNYELWRSDGTNAGTYLLRGFPSAASLKNLTAYNNKVYFIVQEETSGNGLFVSNGSENGTKLLKVFSGTINAGISGVVNEQLLISTYDVNDSGCMHRSDGTTEGTILVNCFGNAFSLNDLTLMENLFFYLNRILPGSDQFELIQSDLTAGNTKNIEQLFPPLELAGPRNLTNVNEVLFFTTNNTSTNESTLWKYNPFAPSDPAPFFSLINAATDEERLWLRDNDTIVKYEGDEINIRYTPGTSGTESVRFILNGSVRRTENEAPYALAGDNSSDYNAWLPSSPGKYTLVAQEYSGNNAAGALLVSTTITFYIKQVTFGEVPLVSAGSDKTITLPSASVSLTGTASDADGEVVSVQWILVEIPGFQSKDSVKINPENALTTHISGLTIPGQYRFRLAATDNSGLTSYDDVVVEVKGQLISHFTLTDSGKYHPHINDGDTLYLSGNKYNIVASTIPFEVGSVKFIYDGKTRIENVEPFALFGDQQGDLNEVAISPGKHTLTGIPYSGRNATGLEGVSKTITFTVIDPNARISLNEISASQAFCYPNPSSDIFHVKVPAERGGNALVEVCDYRGLVLDKLFEGIIQESDFLSVEWDASGYQPGVYFMRIKIGNEVRTEKLVLN